MRRGEDEALYGGAAGGGKSDALVIEALRQVEIPHYKGLILRKTYPQLTELIDKSLRYYKVAYPDARYNDSKHTWTFPSGAKIIFGSMNHSKDKLNYQGQAYDFIAFDELTHFTYDEYIYLVSRNRPNGPGTRCYIRSTANPGGVGHGWVKERFVTAGEPGKTIWGTVTYDDPDEGRVTRHRSRVFIPAKVYDNKELLKNDPTYLARLASMPAAEKAALLDGSWDSYSGQFFSEWRNDPAHYLDRRWTHVCEPFDISSANVRIYRSYDFGYEKPFSCGWWAVTPDGTFYRIMEWYGSDGTPNKGLEMDPEDQFREIKRIENEHPWFKGRKIYGVADPSIWDGSRGVSIAEMAERNHVYFEPGINDRIPGWMQCHYRLQFNEQGYARMYVFKNCKDFIRTIPALVFSEKKIEDLDTDGEDHAADEWRYFCMSHPVAPRMPVKAPEYRPFSDPLDILR